MANGIIAHRRPNFKYERNKAMWEYFRGLRKPQMGISSIARMYQISEVRARKVVYDFDKKVEIEKEKITEEK